MDTLHTVLRSIQGETKSRRDHVSVFREFLDHLDRIAKQRPARAPRARKPTSKCACASAETSVEICTASTTALAVTFRSSLPQPLLREREGFPCSLPTP